MNQYNHKFYLFMRATRGNWRNSFHISCGKTLCPYGISPLCKGFLMAIDADGSPIILPVEAVREFTGEAIEPLECNCSLMRQVFESIYATYIEWHTDSANECYLYQLGKKTQYP